MKTLVLQIALNRGRRGIQINSAMMTQTNIAHQVHQSAKKPSGTTVATGKATPIHRIKKQQIRDT